jgi:hypothetical protein
MPDPVPSPRQGECRPGSLLERDPVAYFKLKHRNVDKQRRRLLAERLERLADEKERHPSLQQFCKNGLVDWEAVNSNHGVRELRVTKLRTIAARLRDKP